MAALKKTGYDCIREERVDEKGERKTMIRRRRRSNFGLNTGAKLADSCPLLIGTHESQLPGC
jgi:hypothetical protein